MARARDRSSSTPNTLTAWLGSIPTSLSTWRSRRHWRRTIGPAIAASFTASCSIAFSAIIIAFAFSLFYLLIRRGRLARLAKSLPTLEGIDIYAYRFAGLGFTFWAIGMLAGSIWAYQSWGIFWNWDPVQTWSLVTWAVFGIYLHLRRFFGWQGEKAAWLFTICFVLTLVSLFLTPLFESSIHAEYFK